MVQFNKISQYGVVILAGGKSSRMGTNKALLPVHGKPNIEHIRDEMRKLIPQNGALSVPPHFILVTNDPTTYEFLGEQMVSDRYPGLGPLAGIQVGLQASPCEWNLVVACDMPMVTAEAALFLLEQAVRSKESGIIEPEAGVVNSVDAVVPVIDEQLHPLFAVYHKRCADKIEEMLISEQLRMIYLLEKLRVRQMTESDFPAHIDTERVFYNMNKPDEWQQVQQWLDPDRRGKA